MGGFSLSKRRLDEHVPSLQHMSASQLVPDRQTVCATVLCLCVSRDSDLMFVLFCGPFVHVINIQYKN